MAGWLSILRIEGGCIREAQRDLGKGVRVLQREDRALDPIGDLERQAQRGVYEVANWVGERSQYQSGICVLFLNFVLIEVLKQSKTLTFLFFYVCFSLKICFSNGKRRGG